MTRMEDADRRFLRHALATLAYRASRSCVGAPEGFGEHRIPGGTRTPAHILSHMGDLMEWIASLFEDGEKPAASTPGTWEAERERFFTELERVDRFVASGAPCPVSFHRLFQGPVADALTHVGQLAMLRRAAGSPVKGESYYRAEVVPGRVGPDQPPPAGELE